MADRSVIERLRETIRRIETEKPMDSTPRLRKHDETQVTALCHPKPAKLDVLDGPYYRQVSALYPRRSIDGLEPPQPSSLEGFRSIDPLLESTENWLYLDIETTGLMGAATVPFLVGLGEWVDSGFLVTQYLLRDRDDESCMLEDVGRAIESHPTLVTFNGKSFDVPVLQGRFVLSDALVPPPIRAHLDLLGFAKNMGKRPEYGYSLKESVRRFVGISRQGDIPGHVIPALYFIYEREKDISLLEPVMNHNRLDVLDMACLVRVFGQVLTGAPELPGDTIAFGGAGKLHYRKGNLSLARKCLETASTPSMATTPDPNHLRLLAHVMRRQGDWEGARRIWEEAIQKGNHADEDYLWLARYHEVVKSDFARSIDLINEAIKRHHSEEDIPLSLKKRKKRLEERIRARERTGLPVI